MSSPQNLTNPVSKRKFNDLKARGKTADSKNIQSTSIEIVKKKKVPEDQRVPKIVISDLPNFREKPLKTQLSTLVSFIVSLFIAKIVEMKSKAPDLQCAENMLKAVEERFLTAEARFFENKSEGKKNEKGLEDEASKPSKSRKFQLYSKKNQNIFDLASKIGLHLKSVRIAKKFDLDQLCDIASLVPHEEIFEPVEEKLYNLMFLIQIQHSHVSYLRISIEYEELKLILEDIIYNAWQEQLNLVPVNSFTAIKLNKIRDSFMQKINLNSFEGFNGRNRGRRKNIEKEKTIEYCSQVREIEEILCEIKKKVLEMDREEKRLEEEQMVEEKIAEEKKVEDEAARTESEKDRVEEIRPPIVENNPNQRLPTLQDLAGIIPMYTFAKLIQQYINKPK
jgi:hypothetical protein